MSWAFDMDPTVLGSIGFLGGFLLLYGTGVYGEWHDHTGPHTAPWLADYMKEPRRTYMKALNFFAMVMTIFTGMYVTMFNILRWGG